MRALLAVVALAVLGGVAYWMMQSGADPVAPPDNEQTVEQDRSPEPVDPVRSERQEVPSPPPTTLPDTKPTSDNGEQAPPGETESTTAAGNVLVHVRHATTLQPIQGFQWRFVQARETIRGESDKDFALLDLPAGAVGDLLVEASTMQPHTEQRLQVPQRGENTKNLDVLLQPAAVATGITLKVRNLDRTPHRHIRVDAFQLTPQTQNTAWQLGRPLWARRASADDGVFELPELPPGTYGILMVATDEQGQLLPRAPFRRSYVLDGTNGHVDEVLLTPACALQLDLLEPNGQPFDPATHGNVTISLNTVGNTGIQRKWTAFTKPNADGKVTGTVSEANRVPGAGRIWLDEPVASGSYLLEIFVNGDPRVSQVLNLRIGEQQVETIYVR